jgi:hypothetical protein
MTQQDGEDLGPWSEFGTAAGLVVGKMTHAVTGEGGGSGGGEVDTGFGDRPDLDGLPPVHSGLGDAPAEVPSVGGAVEELDKKLSAAAAPKGYHNRVDADGDGHLDKATYRGDGHGGAEILVDVNHDGKVDFIGHDTDLDNRVDFADYDKDHDGVFDKRMYDDNNDGYLDRTEWLHDSHDS